MESIYSLHRTGNPSFEGTLRLLDSLISSRLLPGFRRVWVQGSNSGKTTLLFTIFEEGRDHRMVFLPIGLRQWRPDGEIDTEVRLMDELLTRLSTGVLNGVIS